MYKIYNIIKIFNMSIYIDKNLFDKNPVYKSIPIEQQKPSTAKNPRPPKTPNHQKLSGSKNLQKLPISKNLWYAKTRFFHISFPPPYIYNFLNLTKTPKKSKENRVLRVLALIIKDLHQKNRVPIAYRSRTQPQNRVPF